MGAMTLLDIFFRWLHISAACLAAGGAFFIRVILPRAIQPLAAEERESVFLRARRGFKFIVHPAILAFLVSGIYNTIRNWGWYSVNNRPYPMALMHGLFGLHALLALAVMTISILLLAGREPIRSHRMWMKVNLVLIFLAIAAASSLKWVRDHTARPEAVTPAVTAMTATP